MKNFSFSTILICFLLVIFTIALPIFIQKDMGEIFSLIINPIIWTGISIVAYFNNDNNIRVKERDRKNVTKTVLIIVLFYIVIYYLLGLFFGFLKTPYSHKLLSIIKNMISIAYVIVLQEYVRYFLVNKSGKEKNGLILISLLFIVINIEWISIFKLFSDASEGFKYICSSLLPLILDSFLLTYLSMNSKNLPGTFYRAIPKIFLLIFPIVPDINWYFTSVLQIFLPFITYIVISHYVLTIERAQKSKIKKNNPIKTIPFLILTVIFICFIAGTFKSMPVAVASNSMNPEFYRGDVVIVNKLNQNEIDSIKIGDIIQYKLDNKFVIHRVVEIIDKDGHIYKTKGDNNNVADFKYVSSSQIVGKVVQVIPKLGYPSIWFGEILKVSPPDNIQT